MADKRNKEILKANNEKSRSRLLQIINGNFPEGFQVLITYKDREPGNEARAEVEKISN